MLRDEYFRRLVDGAHIELYLSGMDGARIYWPWRMLTPKDTTKSYRDACERFIIDSDISDPSVKTQDVFKAGKVGAEVVSLVDYLPFKQYEQNLNPEDDPEKWSAYQQLKREYESGYSATLHSLSHGLEYAQQSGFNGDILIPLQKPWVQCWKELGKPTNHPLGIGGLKDGRDSERVKAARELRNVVGDEVWIHGFGWGVGGLANVIRSNPGLIDSVDYSTPVQDNVRNDATPGEEVKSVNAARAGADLIEDLREVSEFPDHKETTQVTL